MWVRERESIRIAIFLAFSEAQSLRDDHVLVGPSGVVRPNLQCGVALSVGKKDGCVLSISAYFSVL